MKALTRRQREILDFIVAERERLGRTPSGPEIARHFRFRDPSSAYQHLHALAQKGYLEITQPGKRQSLAIRLRDAALALVQPAWPVLGTIPAGPLTDNPEEVQRRLERVEDLVPGLRAGDYFLVVDGDSMIDAGLLPGQFVVVRPGVVPEPGEICAVWIDGQGGTLKRVYPEGDAVRLVPANPKYAPQHYAADEVRVQGVVVAALNTQMFRR